MKRFMTAMIVIAALALGGCGFPWSESGRGTGPGGETGAPGDNVVVEPTPASDEVTVTLYFSDHQAQHAVPEERTISLTGNETIAEAAVRELLKGPEDPYLHPAFPENTRVLSVQVSDGVAHVNFEEGINIPGSAGETMAIRTLVYTLTDLEGIDRVQILIGGRGDVSLGGHIVLSGPTGRGEILDYPIFVDEDRVAWLQEEADAGRQAWRRDPLEVARFDGRMAGLTGDEEFVPVESGDDGIALYRVTVDGVTYQLELLKAYRDNPGSIWVLTAVDRVE